MPTPDQPTWSLITVTFNNAGKLRHFWARFSPSADVEWIVVDNASTDDSADVARSLGARVIELRENLGFGGGNNRGFAVSHGRYIAFVNPDVSPVLADLPVLQREIDRDAQSLVAPQLLNNDGTLQPNGRGLPYLVNKVRNRRNPAQLAGSYLHYANPGESKTVDWLMGAMVAGRRDHLQKLGPWDERFFVYYEDSDLGLRNSRLGGRSRIIGDARWVHGWARETSSASVAAWRRELPSMVKFYTRYPRLLSPSPLWKQERST